jgi:hypothetical protein
MTEETKKPKFCDKSSEGTVASFTFGDGTVLSLDVANLSEEIQNELMLHGALQKIGDSYAGAAGDYGYAKAQAEKVIQNLLDGVWKSAREAGEAKPKSGELVQALAEIKGLELEAVAAAVEAMDDERRKAVRSHPVVKAKIAEIRARKANEAAAKAGALDF